MHAWLQISAAWLRRMRALVWKHPWLELAMHKEDNLRLSFLCIPSNCHRSIDFQPYCDSMILPKTCRHQWLQFFRWLLRLISPTWRCEQFPCCCCSTDNFCMSKMLGKILKRIVWRLVWIHTTLYRRWPKRPLSPYPFRLPLQFPFHSSWKLLPRAVNREPESLSLHSNWQRQRFEVRPFATIQDMRESNYRSRRPMHKVPPSWLECLLLCAQLSCHEYCECRDSPRDTPPNVPDSISLSWLCLNKSNCIFLFLFWSDKLSICAVRSLTRWRVGSSRRDAQRDKCHHQSLSKSLPIADPLSWGSKGCMHFYIRRRVI